jgi:cardiolipin synthase
MPPEPTHWSAIILSILLPLTDFVIRIGLSIRVIMRKRQYGVTLAWLIVILLLPFFGAIIYLFLGENRIGETRAKRANASLDHYLKWLECLQVSSPVDWNSFPPSLEPIHIQAENLLGIPAMAGNSLEIIGKPELIMRAIIRDIEGAQSTCHLQFYIWHEGGTANEVVRALIHAAQRGVTCRVLIDSIGSNSFLKGKKIRELREAGVNVEEALPAGFFKALFVRIDIRNHRKVVIIDGKIAYTGSQNMADPDFFKQASGVGQWVDIMVRIEGPVVEALAGTFISDWLLENDSEKNRSLSLDQDIDHIRRIADIRHQPPLGNLPVQLVPSGPGFAPDAIHHLLLTTIYSSRRKICLTTPYFVPGEAILTALKSASLRGVEVTIIVPETNDSKLVHHASWARYEELILSGISVKLFNTGLLHSKTITVDDDFAILGSVNLDMRSLWLNFELSLFIYDSTFCKELLAIQHDYQAQSRLLTLDELNSRSLKEKFFQNTALIIGPLL